MTNSENILIHLYKLPQGFFLFRLFNLLLFLLVKVLVVVLLLILLSTFLGNEEYKSYMRNKYTETFLLHFLYYEQNNWLCFQAKQNNSA